MASINRFLFILMIIINFIVIKIIAKKSIVEESIVTTTSSSTSTSVINATDIDNDKDNNDDDQNNNEKDKHRANELIKSMRRLPINHSWYLGDNQNNHNQNYHHYRRKNAQFINGWRAISLPKLKFPVKDIAMPIKFQQSSISTSTTIMTVPTTAETTMITEKPNSISTPTITITTTTPIPTTTTTTKSSTTEIINQPMIETNNSNTYALKCIINDVQYSNGEQILTNDDHNPCTYCRCFYGQKICQQHICPSAPSLDCLAEQKPEQCCPIYTCKTIINTEITDNQNNQNNQNNDTIENNKIKSRGPQFISSFDKNLVSLSSSENELSQTADSLFQNSQRRNGNGILMPINSLEYFYNNNNPSINNNRIHFPSSSLSSVIKHGTNDLVTPTPSILINEMNKQWSIIPTNKNSMLKLNSINNNEIKILQQNDNNVSSPIRTQPQSPISLLTTTTTTTKKLFSTTTPAPLTTIFEKESKHSTPAPAINHQFENNSNNGNSLMNLFQISGCNIYGKMYKTNEKINELSNKCKTCLCTISGVKCNNDINNNCLK